MEEKEKSLHGLGPAHSEAGPTTRIQPRLKKEAHIFLIFLWIFGEFCKIFVFIEKEKNESKGKKACMGLV